MRMLHACLIGGIATTKWKWEPQHQKAFAVAKQVIAKETLLAYPDFNKPFQIHADANHCQLGAVVSQEGKPIAFYSCKLNPAQTRYTAPERELLSIVKTLKECHNMLLGQTIKVFTDHTNLVCKHFNTERVMHWRLLLEEFGPQLMCIKGTNNIVADALIRLVHATFKGTREGCFCATALLDNDRPSNWIL